MPKEGVFRHCFIAPKDEVFLTNDYSQYELRVLAELSQDQELLRIFRKREELVTELEALLDGINEVTYTEDIGKEYPEIDKKRKEIESYDFHSQTAISMFKIDPTTIDINSDSWKKIRSVSKTLSFGIPYGSGIKAIVARSTLNEEEAKEALNKYFNTFKGVKKYIDDTKAEVVGAFPDDLEKLLKIKGCTLTWSEVLDGRKRFYLLPHEGEDYKRLKAAIQRQAVNAKIQSVNASVTKLAMILLYNTLKDPKYLGAKIRLMVHDELVVSCKKHLAKEIAKLQIAAMKKASEKYLTSVATEVGCVISEKWDK